MTKEKRQEKREKKNVLLIGFPRLAERYTICTNTNLNSTTFVDKVSAIIQKKSFTSNNNNFGGSVSFHGNHRMYT